MFDAPVKIFAGILLMELNRLVEDNMVTYSQTGFRKGNHTIVNILAFATTVEMAWQTYHRTTYVAFVDFGSAFDTVRRELMWLKLHRWGIPPGLLKIIIAHHTNSQRCRWGRA